MLPLTLSTDKLAFMEGGAAWTWRGTLDWAWLSRFFHEGEAVARQILVDRRSVGANTICTAAMSSWSDLDPRAMLNYWDDQRGIRRACDLAAEEAMRLCFVVFTTTRQLGFTDLASQKNHWERFYVTLGDKPNVTLVLVNQPGQTDQPGFDPMAFERTQPVASFAPLLCARANPSTDNNPPIPAWDFSCFCCTRDEDRWMTIGSSMAYVVNGWPKSVEWAGTKGASVLFESWHATPGTVFCDPGLGRQIGRSLCFKGTVGGNAYGDQLAASALLTGEERDYTIELLGNIPAP